MISGRLCKESQNMVAIECSIHGRNTTGIEKIKSGKVHY